jgi:imidazolonepropionase
VLIRNIGQLWCGVGEVLGGHALCVVEGRIAAIVPERELRLSGEPVIDAEGGVVLPGWVDPHTHLPHAGQIQGSFVDRCAALEAIPEEALERSMRRRIEWMAQSGTTALEIKTAYASSVEGEAKCLRVMRRLRETSRSIVRTTLMDPIGDSVGADFIDSIGYIEARASSTQRRKFHLGIDGPITNLAEALSQNPISVEHLLHASDADIAMLAQSQAVAVLLPAMPYYTRAGRYGPARKLIEAGVTVALGTDSNPGDSPTDSMPFVIHLACREMGVTVEEAIRMATLNAAKAIGIDNEVGSIEIGKRAYLQILATDDYRDVAATMGSSLVLATLRGNHVDYRVRPEF